MNISANSSLAAAGTASEQKKNEGAAPVTSARAESRDAKVLLDRLHQAAVAVNATATQLRLDGFDAVRAVKQGFHTAGVAGARLAVEVQRAKEAARFADPNDSMRTLGGRAAMAIAPLSALSGAVKSVTQVEAAYDAVEAWRNEGTAAARNHAIGTVAKASVTVAGTVFASAESYVLANKLLFTYRASAEAFSAVVPTATTSMTRGMAWAATKHLLDAGGRPTAAVADALKARGVELGISGAQIDAELAARLPSGALRGALRDAAKELTEKEGVSLAEAMGVGSRGAAREALADGVKAVAAAGTEASAKAAASTLARGLARFAPGLNVAIAAMDTAQAYSTVKDPKASLGKKVCSVITAAGAWVSATNVPGLSQTGAVVSIVSAFTGAFL